jgi:transcriptional regulator with XRE-family HTH domain
VLQALAEARQRAGLSQTQLAERLGKRQQFVSKYESGERRLDFVELVDIARALELDACSLIKGISARD